MSTGLCDVAENCDGATASCPADSFKPVYSTCRAAAGDCDVAESCDGATASCPADSFKPTTSTCRVAAGDCDVAESCTGTSAACPADSLQPATFQCRQATGECDPQELCSGTTAQCPQDKYLPDGVPCSSGSGTCNQGKCNLIPDLGPGDLGPDGTDGGSDAFTDALDATPDGDSQLDGFPEIGGDVPVPIEDGCSCELSSAPRDLAWPVMVVMLGLLFRRRRRAGR